MPRFHVVLAEIKYHNHTIEADSNEEAIGIAEDNHYVIGEGSDDWEVVSCDQLEDDIEDGTY